MRYWGGDSTLQMVSGRSELSTVFHHTGLTIAGLLRTFQQNQNISTLKMLNKIYQNEMFDLFPQSWHLCWLLIPSRCEDCGLRPSVTMLGSHSLTDNINSPSPVVTRVTSHHTTPHHHTTSYHSATVTRWDTTLTTLRHHVLGSHDASSSVRRNALVKWRQYNTCGVLDFLRPRTRLKDWLSEIRNIFVRIRG